MIRYRVVVTWSDGCQDVEVGTASDLQVARRDVALAMAEVHAIARVSGGTIRTVKTFYYENFVSGTTCLETANSGN